MRQPDEGGQPKCHPHLPADVVVIQRFIVPIPIPENHTPHLQILSYFLFQLTQMPQLSLSSSPPGFSPPLHPAVCLHEPIPARYFHSWHSPLQSCYQLRQILMSEELAAKYLRENTQIQREKQMREFVAKYELKDLTLRQMYDIYKNHIFEPPFKTTLYSALVLIVMPGLTNVYYTLKPNAMMARIAPFAMPVICLAQYLAAFKFDMQNYCFTDNDESEVLRKKYLELSKLEGSRTFKQMEEDIQLFYKIKKEGSKLPVLKG